MKERISGLERKMTHYDKATAEAKKRSSEARKLKKECEINLKKGFAAYLEGERLFLDQIKFTFDNASVVYGKTVTLLNQRGLTVSSDISDSVNQYVSLAESLATTNAGKATVAYTAAVRLLHQGIYDNVNALEP